MQDPELRGHRVRRLLAVAAFLAEYSHWTQSLQVFTRRMTLCLVPLWNRIVRFDAGTIAAFNTVHNDRPENSPVSFTYILGFVLEGRPVVYTKTLKSANGTAEIGRPEVLADGEVLFTGQSDIVDHLSSVSIPDTQGPVALLRSIIDHQARRTPNKVGGPVDIIRLTANGVEWLERKPQCRDQE